MATMIQSTLGVLKGYRTITVSQRYPRDSDIIHAVTVDICLAPIEDDYGPGNKTSELIFSTSRVLLNNSHSVLRIVHTM